MGGSLERKHLFWWRYKCSSLFWWARSRLFPSFALELLFIGVYFHISSPFFLSEPQRPQEHDNFEYQKRPWEDCILTLGRVSKLNARTGFQEPFLGITERSFFEKLQEDTALYYRPIVAIEITLNTSAAVSNSSRPTSLPSYPGRRSLCQTESGHFFPKLMKIHRNKKKTAGKFYIIQPTFIKWNEVFGCSTITFYHTISATLEICELI